MSRHWVQHLVSLLWTNLWELNVLSKRTIAQQWCHNKFALCIMWICATLLRTKIILWMKSALCVDMCWLHVYLARRKRKNKIRFIQGTRFVSILFNLFIIRGVVQHKWRMKLICAMVQDFAISERSIFYSTRQSHQSFTFSPCVKSHTIPLSSKLS